jgi:hypothetical protein
MHIEKIHLLFKDENKPNKLYEIGVNCYRIDEYENKIEVVLEQTERKAEPDEDWFDQVFDTNVEVTPIAELEVYQKMSITDTKHPVRPMEDIKIESTTD